MSSQTLSLLAGGKEYAILGYLTLTDMQLLCSTTKNITEGCWNWTMCGIPAPFCGHDTLNHWTVNLKGLRQHAVVCCPVIYGRFVLVDNIATC